MESYKDLMKFPIFQTNLQILRSWCFWGAIISMAQSIVFGVITLYEIFAYNCFIPFPNAPNNFRNLFKSILLDMYFKGSCRNNKSSKLNLDNIAVILKSSDLLISNCVYLAANIIWLISSVILLLSLKNKRFSLNGGVILPWIIISCTIWLFDLSFGVIFNVDLSRLVTQLNKLSIVKNEELYKYSTTVIIMIVMVIKAFKGYLLWIVNAIAIIYISVHYVRCTQLGTKNIERINLYNMGSKAKINQTRKDSTAGITKPSNMDGYTNEGYILETNSNENVANMVHIMSNLDESTLNRAAVTCSKLPNRNTYRTMEAQEPNSELSPNEINSKLHKTTNTMQLAPCDNVSTPSPDYTPPLSRSISSDNARFSSNANSLSSF